MNEKRDAENENLSRNRVMAAVIVAAAAAVLLVALAWAGAHRRYSSFETVRTQDKNGNVSRYVGTDGGTLRYSADGAALLDRDFNARWNLTFTMTNVSVDVCGSEILLYDRQGTSVVVCSSGGKVASFSTELPILRARISGADTVAALLDSGSTVEFVYYAKDGSEIASGRSGMSDPGYAAALAVSDDGMQVCISYMNASEGGLGSTLRIYDFSSEKKESGDNLVMSGNLDGSLVPDVAYLGSGIFAAFGDDAFYIYRGTEKAAEVNFDEEIVSIFYDAAHLGFIFPSDDTDHRYKMQIYSLNGKLRSETYIDNAYTNVIMSGGQVILSDSSSFSVYTAGGFCRFSGEVAEGNVSDVLRTGSNRYLIATDQLVEEVRLK